MVVYEDTDRIKMYVNTITIHTHKYNNIPVSISLNNITVYFLRSMPGMHFCNKAHQDGGDGPKIIKIL